MTNEAPSESGIVSVTDIAQMARTPPVSRTYALQLTRMSGFPPPIGHPASGPVWDRDEVQAFLAIPRRRGRLPKVAARGDGPADIAAAVARYRGLLNFTTERQLQAALAALFAAEGYEARREKTLSPEDRPDFLIGATAIEVKVKGTPAELTWQIGRYLAHGEIGAVVVVTTKARHRNIPPDIGGKPVLVVWLGTAC